MSFALKNDLQSINEEKSTKDKIFSVAARLMAEKGYNGVSMREISEESEVSKPTLYYYFGNKEGIFRELVETSVEHLLEDLKIIKEKKISAKEKLVLVVKNNFIHYLQSPELVKFMFSLATSVDEMPFLKSIREQAIQKNTYILEMVKEGIESGEFGRSTKPELSAEIIQGTLGHFYWLQVNNNELILTEQLAEEIIEFLFKGLNE